MSKHWILIVGVVLFAVGCERYESGKSLKNETPNAESAAVKKLDLEKPIAVAKLDAHQVLDGAIAAAKADDKALFVHFGADW